MYVASGEEGSSRVGVRNLLGAPSLGWPQICLSCQCAMGMRWHGNRTAMPQGLMTNDMGSDCDLCGYMCFS